MTTTDTKTFMGHKMMNASGVLVGLYAGPCDDCGTQVEQFCEEDGTLLCGCCRDARSRSQIGWHPVNSVD